MNPRPKAWRAQRLILHIGAPRTGTTTVQAMLRRNRAALLKQGTLFPETLEHTLVAAMASAWPSDVQQRRMGITGPRAVRRLRRDLAASFGRELDQHRPDTIILSAEQFFDRLDTAPVRRRLKRWLSQFTDRIEILVYLRRQDQAIWSRHLNSNRLGRQDAWVTPGRLLPRYDYERRLRPWVKRFGKDAITVRPYRRDAFPNGSILRDFVQAASLAPNTLDLADTQHNRSLDTVRAEFMRRITDHIGYGDDPDAFRQDMGWVIDRVHGNWSPSRLPAREAETILALYQHSNRRLAETWNHAQPFFDDAIDPDPEPPDTLSVDDAMQIAAGLWTVKAAQVHHLRNRLAKLQSGP